VILDWRSKRYRGGSRWLAAGVFAVSVGVTVPAVVIEAADGEIIYVQAHDRTVAVPAVDRTVAVPAHDRTILVEARPTP
jgi:hypothetical protein